MQCKAFLTLNSPLTPTLAKSHFSGNVIFLERLEATTTFPDPVDQARGKRGRRWRRGGPPA